MVLFGLWPGGFNKCDVFMCSAVNQVWESAVWMKKKVLIGAESTDISEASFSQCAAFICLLASKRFFSLLFLGDISTFPIRDAGKSDAMRWLQVKCETSRACESSQKSKRIEGFLPAKKLA